MNPFYNFFSFLRARQIKLSKIASILEIETIPIHKLNQPRIFTATANNQHQSGKDFNLTIVRNCPGR